MSDQQQRDAERADDRHSEFAVKVTEAAIENANLAMRTAVLINGGAAISVLAFAGALASQGKFAVVTQVASSLLWFALGAVAATIAMMFAYATNYCIAERSWSFDRRPEHPYIFPTERWWAWHRAANASQLLAALGGLASVGLFCLWHHRGEEGDQASHLMRAPK